jgi:acyl dehydratase
VRAVEDITRIYEDSNSVPPMAVAALAMAAMGKQMELPPGSIHVSQEFEFTNVVKLGETLTSYATVKRNLARGKLHMLTIGINVVNREKNTVVSGETGFILPRS